jgi:predicted transcriptional regulator
MKVLRIGIASVDEMQARTRAILSGKRKRRPDEPKLWFSSEQTLFTVLSRENRKLLDEIRRRPPASMTELAERTGRKLSNLSRTLSTMANFGIVEFRRGAGRQKIPVVAYERIDIVMPLEAAA